jgi:hypothetical protein
MAEKMRTSASSLPLGREGGANAAMKCITKAKRRATLSVCGLGLLDETGIETIPAAVKHDPHDNIMQVTKQRLIPSGSPSMI